ncbi:MAG: DUF1553 domain-containing protein [Planctomycetales bacterium]|nr:DUF1553 domain-containing protein [Planctomycetales bacterium]
MNTTRTHAGLHLGIILLRNRWRSLVALCMAWSMCAHLACAQLPAAEVQFDRDVLPVLRKHCLDCHGPGSRKDAEGSLQLDTMLGALRGGDSGEPVIVPGAADKSHLLTRVTAETAADRMPPDKPPLAPHEIELLRGWIADASQWKSAKETLAAETVDHWAFQPVSRPALPEATSANSAIDALVFAKLREHGLEPSPTADRRSLIRRLFLVMHGLPPTPERVEQFVRDERVDAWERLVDEVLESPRYGEQWASYWLDLVRFGETHGFETNRERPNAWRYRDWVIDALNRDLPYDRFILDQLAGDARGADVATGFLVAGPYDLVKGQDKNLQLMQRQDELADMVDTTGAALLGLTIGCARCHNHKFDPITQTDYYAMQAVFAGVQHGDRSLPPSTDAAARLAEIDAELQSLRSRLAPYLRVDGLAHRLIDEQQPPGETGVGAEFLQTPRGKGMNPAGNEPGFANDPGDRRRSPNVSGGEYTWWANQPGQDFVVYRPHAAGSFRVWLSWGAGFPSHTSAAHYLWDADGDLTTTEDQQPLATIDQRLAAAEQSAPAGELAKQPLWSGFFDAGVHELTGSGAILLRGGDTGEAITADVVLLEPTSDKNASSPARPRLRQAVAAEHNIERFPPTPARFVRFTILRSNSAQPCIDELEVYSGPANVGLASNGAKATSSGDFVHALHKLEHINDGRHGNPRSWIAAAATGWVQLELADVAELDRIEWGRDRDGRYRDRIPVEYRVELSLDGEQWQLVASHADRLPYRADESAQPLEYDFSAAAEDAAAQGERDLSRLHELTESRKQLTAPVMAYAGTFAQPGPTHRLYRGEFQNPREQVAPGSLESLRFQRLQLGEDSPERERRLGIAQWIAHPANPLTARVIVNRLWQHHFGAGLADTPSDFGANGVPPSHPELLDWLAAELLDNNWSLKHLHRQILTSRTWRQDSAPRAEALAKDASTRLWWRFPPRRLRAEPIRDGMLAVSGTLDLTMGGPGFSAFEIDAENVRHYHPKQSYGPADWRRMIYMTRVRQERDSVFGAFDCPDFSQAVPKRSRSTTPLQALNLLNSAFVLQQSEHFAKRLAMECDSDEQRVSRAYALCYGRPAAAEEITAALELVAATNWTQFARALLNSNEFVFIP